MQRWTFHDPVAGDTLRLRANPRRMATPVVPHRTTSAPRSVNGKMRALRAPSMPQQWSFEGRLRRQEEYDDLLGWAGRPNRITITDHLGRQHSVIPVAFEPTAVEKSGVGNGWLFDYVFKALYLSRLV